MGRYWVTRRGEWIESVMIEADDPSAALKRAEKVPEPVWRESRWETWDGTDDGYRYTLGGVSLSDTREPWDATSNQQGDSDD